jgi:hypothetical protein
MLLLSKYICLEILYQVYWKSGESHFWVGLMETKKHILLLDDLLSMTAWKSVYIMIGGLFDSNGIFVKIKTIWFFSFKGGFIHRSAILWNSYETFICTMFYRKFFFHSNLFLKFIWLSYAVKHFVDIKFYCFLIL